MKHQLSAEEAKHQAAELVRKARIKREREEAELARTREREVRAQQPAVSRKTIEHARSNCCSKFGPLKWPPALKAPHRQFGCFHACMPSRLKA